MICKYRELDTEVTGPRAWVAIVEEARDCNAREKKKKKKKEKTSRPLVGPSDRQARIPATRPGRNGCH